MSAPAGSATWSGSGGKVVVRPVARAIREFAASESVMKEGGANGPRARWMLVRTGPGPFTEGSLDEAFGLAIGLWSVGAAEEMA